MIRCYQTSYTDFPDCYLNHETKEENKTIELLMRVKNYRSNFSRKIYHTVLVTVTVLNCLSRRL